MRHLDAPGILFAVACLVAYAEPANAFKLKPTGTPSEGRTGSLEGTSTGLFDTVGRWVMDHFSHSVHEEITHRIWGCDTAPDDRSTCSAYGPTPASVLYGVHWNDNPPFALEKTTSSACRTQSNIRLPFQQLKCWLLLFKDASTHVGGEERYDRRSGKALLYRVHFGDMQFLHSMASWDGESMRDTKANILMWAEFSYKVALGQIAVTTTVNQVPVDGFKRLFAGNGYDVQTLFTRGVPEYRSSIKFVALGSLLHMIQDSFAKGHVHRDNASGECESVGNMRRAGRILGFHSFGSQDPGKHGDADSRDALEVQLINNTPSVVDVGREVKKLFDRQAPWAGVRRLLDECVFEVSDDDLDRPAGPGSDYRK